jgi:hypothetical protein
MFISESTLRAAVAQLSKAALMFHQCADHRGEWAECQQDECVANRAALAALRPAQSVRGEDLSALVANGGQMGEWE